MRIAVLSGKGGTGKTTVAASLAASLVKSQYVDCDVEEPNGALFLKPKLRHMTSVNVRIPVLDESRCDGCGACGGACRFHAIAVVKGKVIIFPEVCHYCGACMIACPRGAIAETDREIGVIESDCEDLFLQGRLDIGESSAVPVINRLKQQMRSDIPVILDCAPGASCTVVQTIDGCDYCILVTEPTPFGLHDLKVAAALVKQMDIAFGVVVNKAMREDQSVQEYCRQEGIELLMEIPYLREIAEGYSNGELPVRRDETLRNAFIGMYERISGGGAA